MIDRAIQSISDFLLKLESRLGLIVTSLLLSLTLICIAILYVQPLYIVAFHGLQFSELSLHPFSFGQVNHLQYRILGPLLGYLTFLRGVNFFLVPWIFIFLFPAVVYYSWRKKNFAPEDACFIACFITFSCVILLPLVSPGYTDVITWFFIFLAFNHAGKIVPSAIYFSLALLNHESSMVLLPGLALYSRSLRKSGFLKILMMYLIACLPHLAYRQYVDAHVSPLYSVSFYFSESNIAFVMRKLILYLPAGLFYTFKLWWIFPLGYIAWSLRVKKYLESLTIGAILAGGCLLAIIAYDYTRMVTIAFPAVMISYAWFREILSEKKLRKITIIIIALNFMILQYQFNYDGAQPMFPWILNKISEFFGTPIALISG